MENQKTDKKLIVSDYDQTFYINDKDIEKNKKMVREFEKEGNIFIIATGRSYFDFKNKADTYHIKYNYVILNHGTTIIDKQDTIIHNFSIDNSIIEKIEKEIYPSKADRLFCCSGLESRVDINHRDLTKIHVKYATKEEAMKINETLNSKYSHFINSYYVGSNSIEIISNQTNKSKAIKLLTQKLKIKEENVYTIGDGYSDIQMIKDFNGCCMEEAVEELKKVAKKQYKSVSDLINEILVDSLSN